jgi:outer membrane protein OmpA-like peptidoglycan-associated protein
VRLENLGDSINSAFADYDPFISLDETNLYFTSRRSTTKGGGKAELDGEYYEDIYVSHKKNGKWGKAKPVEGMNKNTNDAITGLSFDGLKMFIYRDVNGGDIYLSEFKGNNWTKPHNLKDINSEFHESSACLSADNKTLYFVSDRPGGEGGRDIYMSTLDAENKWSKPVNLGADINSTYDEDRVYVHPYSKALFFSSKGHNSLGGYDIFSSDYANGQWSKPKNLGYPINDVDDDFAFVITDDLKHGYYSSFKENGKGDKDIYFIDFTNIKNDPSLESISVGIKSQTSQDSIDALLAIQQRANDSITNLQMKAPLAFLSTKQINILDSLAKTDKKITSRTLNHSELGVPLGKKDINTLDSLAKTDHHITANILAMVSAKDLDHNATFTNVNELPVNISSKQLNILDSLAKSNGKITAESLNSIDFRKPPLSAYQIHLLDSLARANGTITASTLNKTNFAHADQNDTGIDLRSQNHTILTDLSSRQISIIDSLAKTDRGITLQALNSTNFAITNLDPTMNEMAAKKINFERAETILTTQQLHILDSLAKANGSVTVKDLDKTNFAHAEQNTPTNTVSKSNNVLINLSDVQLHILDSIAKTNGKITAEALNKTAFITSSLGRLANDATSEKRHYEKAEAILTIQQLHILDSLAKTNGSITAAAISKTNFAVSDNKKTSAQVNTSQNKNSDVTEELALTTEQFHILDSLAKTNGSITAVALNKTNFDEIGLDAAENVTRFKKRNSRKIEDALTIQQMHILDSLAKANGNITVNALSKTNFTTTADKNIASNDITTESKKIDAIEAVLTKQQLHILDSIAKASGSITNNALSQTNFVNANNKTISANNATNKIVKGLSPRQIHLLDSLARADEGITMNALNKAKVNVNVSTDQKDYSKKPVKQNTIIDASDASLTSQQLHILDSLAKANGNITVNALSQTKFALAAQPVSTNTNTSVNTPKNNNSITSLNEQQVHVLDSIAKANGSITINALNKSDFAGVNKKSANTVDLSSSTSHIVFGTNMTTQQIGILDSLSRVDKKITTESLSKTKFGIILEYPNGDILTTNNIDTTRITFNRKQIRLLDSLARKNKSITASTLTKANFIEAAKQTVVLDSKTLATRNEIISNNNEIISGINISRRQLEIADSLAKVNGSITIKMLTNTKFGQDSKDPGVAGTSLTKKQIRILDSLATVNQSITINTLMIANFSGTQQNDIDETTFSSTTTKNEEENVTDKKAKGTEHETSIDNKQHNNTASIPIDTIPVFNPVLFEFNQSKVKEEDATELNRLITYLRQHPHSKVKLTGHTDSKGSDTYNLALSKKRAMFIATYLVEKGINKNRVKIDYKGEAYAAAPNENPDRSDNPEGRRLNRRVEMKIMEK